MATKKIEEIKMKTTTTEKQEENQSEELNEEQEYLELRYGVPLKLLSPEARVDIVAIVSEVLGRDGEVEVKRLILENRLPIMAGPEGNWYTEWYPDGAHSPTERLVTSAAADTEYFLQSIPERSPEFQLRECLARTIDDEKYQLTILMMQLEKGGEHSAELAHKIECLGRLNTSLPFSPEEFSRIVN